MAEQVGARRLGVLSRPERPPDDPVSWRQAYRLRWKRRRLLARAFRKRRQLRPVADRTERIVPGEILGFATLRNEAVRLPYFMEHYRRLGVDHFLVVDNDSTDETPAFLADQPDVSVWRTTHSYRLARFGVDWLTWLQIRYGHGHWCLSVDADELLIYPNWQTRPLPALTNWLDLSGRSSFATTMLDMYPEGRIADVPYRAGQDPIAVLPWFDAGNYMIRKQMPLGNLWIQGGVRSRMFFADRPRLSPTLNKIPLVKWNRRFVYVNSTHSALPRRLNAVYGTDGSEEPSGVLLHTKFLDQIVEKSGEELQRREHFANSSRYDDYYRQIMENPVLWTPGSTRYRGWRHLEAAGLISRGGWL